MKVEKIGILEHHGTNMTMNFLVEELWKIKLPVYSPLINRISGSREMDFLLVICSKYQNEQ